MIAALARRVPLPAIWATLIALACASLLILAVGGAPLEVYRQLVAGTWRNAYGIGQVLFKTTPLVFTGLAVAVALHAGLFNIGAEGQLTVGAFATAVIGAHLSWRAAAQPWLAVPLCLAAGFLGGAAIGVIPGLLKAYRGAHEVINTIMLNFIVRAAMVGAGTVLFERESIHTAPIARAAELPRLGAHLVPSLHGSAVNGALALAMVAAAATWWLLYRTRIGFALRAVGASPTAAETAGLSVARVRVLAMALSGGIAGLVGANFVLGYKHYYEDNFSGGIGYMGIAVAVLGRMHPVGIVAAALLFGTLSQGALAVNATVPKEIVDVLQAVVILAVAASAPEVRRLMRDARRDGRGRMMHVAAAFLSLSFLAAVLRISVPYALAALGGTWSERSGVVNIGLEGMLLVGAFAANVGAERAGSGAAGVAAGAAAGALIGALYALLVVRFRGDQIVCGVAVNLLADGLTRFLLKATYDSSSNSPRVDVWSWGGAGLLASLAHPLVIATVLVIVASHVLLYRTPFGLRVRAVGEHPEAAASLGVRPARVRVMALLASGTLAGLGGAWLAADQRQFVAGMSNGRGYIALAAMIFGKWRPAWVAAAALLYGAAEATTNELQTAGIGVPGWLVQMLPYVITMVTLAGFIGRATPPRALGQPLR